MRQIRRKGSRNRPQSADGWSNWKLTLVIRSLLDVTEPTDTGQVQSDGIPSWTHDRPAHPHDGPEGTAFGALDVGGEYPIQGPCFSTLK